MDHSELLARFDAVMETAIHDRHQFGSVMDCEDHDHARTKRDIEALESMRDEITKALSPPA